MKCFFFRENQFFFRIPLKVALEVLELLAPRCLISPLCREIFHLLQTPHLQVSPFSIVFL